MSIWKRIQKKWASYWENDVTDIDKKHLSQSDKRSIWYGAFMICMFTIAVTSFWSGLNTKRVNEQNMQDMDEIMRTLTTYLATATDDEYEEIAQTIRHDLIYSQYGQDIENLIQYVPNTAEGCCVERDDYPERANLVFLNTGETYGLDIFDNSEPIASQRNRGGTMINSGYDEISEAYIRITKNTDRNSGIANIDRGRGIVSAHKMKMHFCDDCIRDILNTVKNEFMDEVVIYDARERKFYPVTEGDLQIGDYFFHTLYEEGVHEIEIEYVGE